MHTCSDGPVEISTRDTEAVERVQLVVAVAEVQVGVGRGLDDVHGVQVDG